MLSQAYSLLILIFSMAGTLFVFGGKAWHEGVGPFYKRTTWRGWASLVCLALTFLFSATKVFHDRNEQQESAEQLRKANELQMLIALSRGYKITSADWTIGIGRVEEGQIVGKYLLPSLPELFQNIAFIQIKTNLSGGLGGDILISPGAKFGHQGMISNSYGDLISIYDRDGQWSIGNAFGFDPSTLYSPDAAYTQFRAENWLAIITITFCRGFPNREQAEIYVSSLRGERFSLSELPATPRVPRRFSVCLDPSGEKSNLEKDISRLKGTKVRLILTEDPTNFLDNLTGPPHSFEMIGEMGHGHVTLKKDVVHVALSATEYPHITIRRPSVGAESDLREMKKEDQPEGPLSKLGEWLRGKIPLPSD